MTDDPEMREQFLLKLRALQADADAEQAVTFVDRELHVALPVPVARSGAPPRTAPLGSRLRGPGVVRATRLRARLAEAINEEK